MRYSCSLPCTSLPPRTSVHHWIYGKRRGQRSVDMFSFLTSRQNCLPSVIADFNLLQGRSQLALKQLTTRQSLQAHSSPVSNLLQCEELEASSCGLPDLCPLSRYACPSCMMAHSTRLTELMRHAPVYVSASGLRNHTCSSRTTVAQLCHNHLRPTHMQSQSEFSALPLLNRPRTILVNPFVHFLPLFDGLSSQCSRGK